MKHALAAAALLLGACSVPEASELAFDDEPTRTVGGDFPAPPELLRGFDALVPSADWSVGDEVVYGLRLERDGQARSWLLRLAVLEPIAVDDEGAVLPPADWSLRINGKPQRFESRLARVEAVVLDELGTELGRSQPLMPRDFLDRGVADACAQVHARLRQLRSRGDEREVYRWLDVRPLAEATVGAVALLQVVQQDDVLAPLLWEVVEKPSLWSLVQNLGARVVVRPRFHALSEAVSPVPEVEAQTWRLPISLLVNDAAALYVDLFVADSNVPFALGSGVLGASARHPSDPGLAFSLRLLSARRAAP